MGDKSVSNSRLDLMDRCGYAHWLKYGLGLVKRKKAEPLIRGSMFHADLEAWNNGESWIKRHDEQAKAFYKKFFKEEIVELGDIPKMVAALMRSYTEFYNEEDIEYVWNEAEFDVPLVGDITLNGFIDTMTLRPDKNFWPMEHKTFGRMPDREFMIFNTQSNRYMWALQQLGYPVGGFIWNIIKAKNPTKPKLTAKTGVLSLAKLDSTPTIVREGLIELGFKPEEYIDYINAHSFESYFFRRDIKFNKGVMDSIMLETKIKAKRCIDDMDSYKDKCIGKNCSWCSYQSICNAELLGYDTDYIIKKEYESRKKSKEEDNGKQSKLKNPEYKAKNSKGRSNRS